ncbi:hypothetical protein [Agrobacterium tumefaciens]|uniref:hypothetical protein n=1 Tax=Agrobacterium tumefaciens TaxID=358 RepID=UPI00157196EB|nr:hypothetical protein [Agrobacterium tumefaciens]NTD84260.1 hypothetical protein [Agrobacterium tumefaciens]NTD94576.1 hypothetical protein [Agrobacterium tumefaciens]NTD96028.1 hypothetical protein [Agrobacterium tumefaciens]NTE13886.1 hypothetical protein [Agrobacterium tumefaciens]NTE19501.1 hypothetical protein [Agrobacterium tumefaciens]
MQVNQEVTIDFANDNNDDRVLAWLKEHSLEADSLSDLTFNAKVEVEIGDLDEDDIVDAYDKLNKLDNSDLYHVGQAYRRMAEGNVDEAMEILSRHFDLSPPSHERAIADLITGKRN